MLLTLAFAGVTFMTTMGGGIAAIRWPARLELLMALAGGVVLGAAAFDLLPIIEDMRSYGRRWLGGDCAALEAGDALTAVA